MSTRDPAGPFAADVGKAFHLPVLAWDLDEGSKVGTEPVEATEAPGGHELSPLMREPTRPGALLDPLNGDRANVVAAPAAGDQHLGEPASLDAETPPWRPPEPGKPEDLPRNRISRPMVAAAATAGLLLVSVPLLLGRIGSSPDQGAGAHHVGQPGYRQPDPGSSGLIPSTAATTGGLGGASLPAGLAGSGVQSQPVTQGPTAGAPPGHPIVGARGEQPSSTGSRGAVAAAPPAARPSYSAITGPGCANAGAGFVSYGYYNQGRSGWATHAGGYDGAGCDGQFLSMPMSGDVTRDDPTSAVAWTFSSGAVSSGSCRVQVFIPTDPRTEAVGGSAAYYTVHNATGAEGSFSVDQVAHRGQWVAVGSFRMTGGKLMVQLHSRGQDWNSKGYDYAHLAASAVSANCTA